MEYETTGGIISFINKWKLYYYGELLLPVVLIINVIIPAITGEPYFGLTALNYLTWYVLALASIVMFALLTYLSVGYRDFRFRSFIHMSILGFIVGVSALQVKGSGYFEMHLPDAEVSFDEVAINLIIIFAPVFVIVASSLFAFYSLTNSFTGELKNITQTFNDKNEKAVLPIQ